MTLEEDLAASELRYSTAKKIGRLLRDLPVDDVPKVLLHVGIEWGYVVQPKTPAPNGTAAQPVPTR